MDESIVDSTNPTDCDDKSQLVDLVQNKNQQSFRLISAWTDSNNYNWQSITSNNDKAIHNLDQDFLPGQTLQSLPSFIQISNLNNQLEAEELKNIYQNNIAGPLTNNSHFLPNGYQVQPINVEMVLADQSTYHGAYFSNCIKNDQIPHTSTIVGSQIISASVPSSIPYKGQYGFEISFDKHCKENKSITWTFSEELEKLYVRMGSTCPIKIRCSFGPAPAGAIIRATPVYVRPEHVQEVVTRCPNHSSNELGDQHPAPTHLMRCEHKMVNYVTDRMTNRQSVIVPLEQPQVGSQWVTNLYQFMCFSSCVGGLNRRPVRVIFTLESGTEIIGRQSFEVRICACPVRDRRVEEGACSPSVGSGPKTANLPPLKKEATKRTGSQLLTTKNSQEDRIKRKYLSDNFNDMSDRMDDNELFTLQVQGRENYELLYKVNEALRLSASINNTKLFNT